MFLLATISVLVLGKRSVIFKTEFLYLTTAYPRLNPQYTMATKNPFPTKTRARFASGARAPASKKAKQENEAFELVGKS